MKKTHLDDIDLIEDQWQQLDLDTDYAALQVVARILRLNKTLDEALSSLHAKVNLKHGEFDVLAALKRSGEAALTPSQLYQSMLLSSGAMTSRLDRLEKKQLIERQHCTEDRRSIKVSLTNTGQQLIDEVYPEHFHLIEKLLNPLSNAEKMQLQTLLKNLMMNLDTTMVDNT
ncbi:MarR family winged helix-turn-helix transcriptional regulator [Methylophaga sp.]|uniref:MarR family winged helix-turn-helix transcriptional regulator n=1 Tax=Methylophaga sp. TaxID=2024840 RepID=UPI003F6A00D7